VLSRKLDLIGGDVLEIEGDGANTAVVKVNTTEKMKVVSGNPEWK